MANNPDSIRCIADTWTKIATDVTVNDGNLWRLSTSPVAYFYTYRTTGDPAPTELKEAVKIFIGVPANNEPINATAIDIYIYAVKRNGYVRVDI